MLTMVGAWTLHRQLPAPLLEGILDQIYLACIEVRSIDEHYCSLRRPCKVASEAFRAFHDVRLVSRTWNEAVQDFVASAKGGFFRRVEEAYYPYPWHINTKVRLGMVLDRYRVYHTIKSDSCIVGVYLAHDVGSNEGCRGAKTVVVKAWVNADDGECAMESAAYDALSERQTHGIPRVLGNRYDPRSEVYAIALQYLGPTLEDFQVLSVGGRLTEKMVLAVVIQMLERYKSLHSLGYVHNGMKPANICIPPLKDSTLTVVPNSTLYAIDFGLSYYRDLASGEHTLPSEARTSVIGNRRFLSIFGHHGISQSQRDDLESLAYLTSALFHGSLPWDLPSPPLKRTRKPQDSAPNIWRVKMSTPAISLFHGMDSAFMDFWREVKGLAFGEVPDYARMRERFVVCWREKAYGDHPGEIDWWDEYNRLQQGDTKFPSMLS